METTLPVIIHISLILAGLILIVLGFIGSVAPALPGPLLAILAPVGLKLLSLGDVVYFNAGWFLVGSAIALTAIILIGETLLPIYGTKRWGGTKYGIWGSTLGLIVGFVLSFVFPPIAILAIIFGPFLGAFIGEKLYGMNNEAAFRSAFGSLVGFIVGTVGKLLVCLYIAGVYIYGVVQAF